MREIETRFASGVCDLVIVRMLRNELRARVVIGS